MWKQNFMWNIGHFKGLQPINVEVMHNFSILLWELRHVGLLSHILRAQALFLPLSPPYLSLIQCMKLRFESWRGSLWEGGGTCSRLTRAPSRQSHVIAAIWDHEQREQIYNFIETRRRVFVFATKMQSKGTKAFSGATFRRFGGELAISEAFVLGRSATKVDKSCKAWLLLVL